MCCNVFTFCKQCLSDVRCLQVVACKGIRAITSILHRLASVNRPKMEGTCGGCTQKSKDVASIPVGRIQSGRVCRPWQLNLVQWMGPFDAQHPDMIIIVCGDEQKGTGRAFCQL